MSRMTAGAAGERNVCLDGGLAVDFARRASAPGGAPLPSPARCCALWLIELGNRHHHGHAARHVEIVPSPNLRAVDVPDVKFAIFAVRWSQQGTLSRGKASAFWALRRANLRLAVLNFDQPWAVDRLTQL
jgi:hypothetical protein